MVLGRFDLFDPKIAHTQHCDYRGNASTDIADGKNLTDLAKRLNVPGFRELAAIATLIVIVVLAGLLKLARHLLKKHAVIHLKLYYIDYKKCMRFSKTEPRL